MLTKLTPEAVKYRLKQLNKSGLIQGFGINANLTMPYYITMLRLQNLSKERLRALMTFGKLHKNVLYIIKSIGSHDVEFEIETTHKIFNEMIKELRNKFSDIIRDLETVEVYAQHKLDYYPMRNNLLSST